MGERQIRRELHAVFEQQRDGITDEEKLNSANVFDELMSDLMLAHMDRVKCDSRVLIREATVELDLSGLFQGEQSVYAELSTYSSINSEVMQRNRISLGGVDSNGQRLAEKIYTSSTNRPIGGVRLREQGVKGFRHARLEEIVALRNFLITGMR